MHSFFQKLYIANCNDLDLCDTRYDCATNANHLYVMYA